MLAKVMQIAESLPEVRDVFVAGPGECSVDLVVEFSPMQSKRTMVAVRVAAPRDAAAIPGVVDIRSVSSPGSVAQLLRLALGKELDRRRERIDRRTAS